MTQKLREPNVTMELFGFVAVKVFELASRYWNAGSVFFSVLGVGLAPWFSVRVTPVVQDFELHPVVSGVR